MNNAKWIKASENKEEACYVFYTDFEIDKKIKSAILKVSAMGLYAAYINKKRIGNELFTPYWTEHKIHTQYQTYDVSDMLRTKNELSIECAEGWAVGYIRTGAEPRNHNAKNLLKIQLIWLK